MQRATGKCSAPETHRRWPRSRLFIRRKAAIESRAIARHDGWAARRTVAEAAGSMVIAIMPSGPRARPLPRSGRRSVEKGRDCHKPQGAYAPAGEDFRSSASGAPARFGIAGKHAVTVPSCDGVIARVCDRARWLMPPGLVMRKRWARPRVSPTCRRDGGRTRGHCLGAYCEWLSGSRDTASTGALALRLAIVAASRRKAGNRGICRARQFRR